MTASVWRSFWCLDCQAATAWRCTRAGGSCWSFPPRVSGCDASASGRSEGAGQWTLASIDREPSFQGRVSSLRRLAEHVTSIGHVTISGSAPVDAYRAECTMLSAGGPSLGRVGKVEMPEQIAFRLMTDRLHKVDHLGRRRRWDLCAGGRSRARAFNYADSGDPPLLWRRLVNNGPLRTASGVTVTHTDAAPWPGAQAAAIALRL